MREAPAAHGTNWWRGGFARARWVWALAGLAAVLMVDLAVAPEFFQLKVIDGRVYGSLIDVLDRASPVMLVALGMTLVIATGGVDLSVGAVMAIAGALSAALVAERGWGFGAAAAGALGAGLLAGAWNGLLVAAAGVPPIVATLILMVAGRGIAQLITDGQIVTFSDPALAWLGSGSVLGIPASAAIALAALGLTGALVRGTALGLFIEVAGANERAGRLAGVSVRSVKGLAYALTGTFAAVAGLIGASEIRAADANNLGLYLELDAILAVVLGGTALTGGRFSLIGSMLGAVLIQVMTTTILMADVRPEWTLVVKAGLVLAVCLLQSEAFRATVTRAARRIGGRA